VKDFPCGHRIGNFTQVFLMHRSFHIGDQIYRERLSQLVSEVGSLVWIGVRTF
jgi:hypothetical protein